MSKLTKEIRAEIKEAFQDGKLQVKSVNESGSVEKRTVSDVMQHNTSHKSIVQVKTESGKTVQCTEDHSLFTLDSEGYPLPVCANDLKVGSPLVVVAPSNDEESFITEKIDSIIFLPPQKHTYDLCVPGPENFVITNGILAHNSYSIGGISLDIEKSSKYEGIKNNAESQLDKMLEAKTRTVKIIRGLQQSRYGVGVRSAFGPSTGSGVLTPARYLGL